MYFKTLPRFIKQENLNLFLFFIWNFYENCPALDFVGLWNKPMGIQTSSSFFLFFFFMTLTWFQKRESQRDQHRLKRVPKGIKCLGSWKRASQSLKMPSTTHATWGWKMKIMHNISFVASVFISQICLPSFFSVVSSTELSLGDFFFTMNTLRQFGTNSLGFIL